MNNDQFRRLLVESPSTQDAVSKPTTRTDARSAAPGSRKSVFTNLAPRSLKTSTDLFTRSYAGSSLQTKRRPARGTKLAPGYEDRTLARLNGTEDAEPRDERAERIAALERRLKEGALSQTEFEKLRDEITGGDIETTHLVKGLDRALLTRIRKGEDVMKSGTSTTVGPALESIDDLDNQLDALESADTAPIEKPKLEKKGELNPAAPAVSAVAGVKRSRNDILAELKAQRQAAAVARMAERPVLGDNFKAAVKPSGPAPPKTTIDHKGREVIILRDETGKVKKKIRRREPVNESSGPSETIEEAPLPLNEVTSAVEDAAPQENESGPQDEGSDDDDIFEGAGTSYDPLGQQDETDDSDTTKAAPTRERSSNPGDQNAVSPTKHNYFVSTGAMPVDDDPGTSNPLSDVAVLAAIKRASGMVKAQGGVDQDDGEPSAPGRDSEEQARLKRRAAMLSTADRDLEDMDLGFGSSRFDDAADGDDDDQRGTLREWKGLNAREDDDEPVRHSKGPKKRSRKRKGDKDSYADVMSVLERRK